MRPGLWVVNETGVLVEMHATPFGVGISCGMNWEGDGYIWLLRPAHLASFLERHTYIGEV